MRKVLKIKVCRGVKEWYYNIVSRNGKVLATGLGYNSRGHALKTAKIYLNATFDIEVEKG